eukprot:6195170-Pleurochrysis_carterae.AAC.7
MRNLGRAQTGRSVLQLRGYLLPQDAEVDDRGDILLNLRHFPTRVGSLQVHLSFDDAAALKKLRDEASKTDRLNAQLTLQAGLGRECLRSCC